MVKKITEAAEKRFTMQLAKKTNLGNWALKGGIAVAGAGAAASVLDFGLDLYHEGREMRQERLQANEIKKKEKEYKKFDMNTYYDLQYISPQELNKNKTGHSNTWGGVKYGG